MRKISFNSYSAKDTIDLAKRIAGSLKKGDTIGLFGDLGCGKTTFVKGLAGGLGLKSKINSPSFVILKIYPPSHKTTGLPVGFHSPGRKGAKDKTIGNGNVSLCHFDLYRLKSLRELEGIGYEDFIGSDAICVIEWADRADGLLPKDCLKVKIKIKAQNSRIININASGGRYHNLLKDIKLIKA